MQRQTCSEHIIAPQYVDVTPLLLCTKSVLMLH